MFILEKNKNNSYEEIPNLKATNQVNTYEQGFEHKFHTKSKKKNEQRNKRGGSNISSCLYRKLDNENIKI